MAPFNGGGSGSAPSLASAEEGAGLLPGAKPHQTKSSVSEACYNFICCTIGTGILSLPFAFWSGGLFFSCILTLIVLVASNYTARILIQTMSELRCSSYSALGTKAMGKIGYALVVVSVNVTLYCVGTLFLILAGSQACVLMEGAGITVDAWIAVSASIVCLLCYLPSIAHVSYISLFGLLATIVTAAVIIVQSISGIHSSSASSSSSHNYLAAGGIGTCFGALSFSFGSHAVYPEIALSLAQPQKWPQVVKISQLTGLALYLPVSILAGLAFQQNVEDNVLGNLTGASGSVAVAFILVHVISAYPAVLATPISSLESLLRLDHPGRSVVLRLLVRTLLVGGTAGLAMVFKAQFGPFLGFIGSGTVTLTAFLLPALFYAKTFWKSLSPLQLAACGGVFVLGIAAGTVGMIYAIPELVAAMQSLG